MSFKVPVRSAVVFAVMCSVLFALQPLRGAAEPAVERDGQHDFDFHLGTWKSEITHLDHPLMGSTKWIKCQGTLAARKVWDGRAQIEELEADCPDHHIEDLLLFLYNPESHQWSLNAAAVDDGVVNRPMFGEFKGGRGEFFDQETYKGRTILVRQVWSDITPTSHHFEQSFSDDGGKTWETNFKATLTRAQ
jgi:hypothetical protein